MKKLLTIGMATFDDFDGVYFTIQALRLYHNILNYIDYEIIVIDNNSKSEHGKAVKNFVENWTQGKGRYIAHEDKISTSIRNEIFKNAKGKYTLCIDCHVMIQQLGIESLLAYYSENADCKDLIQGPLLYDDLKNYATEFSNVWRDNMYGIWSANHEAFKKNLPFDIPMMGLGLFSCETKNWLRFNENFRGFGGEEGYIHEKFRLNGGRCLCLPQLGWIHRFGRPSGVKYRLQLEDRVWNYYVGWLELTKNPEHEMIHQIHDHFKNKISEQKLKTIFEEAKTLYNL